MDINANSSIVVFDSNLIHFIVYYILVLMKVEWTQLLQS